MSRLERTQKMTNKYEKIYAKIYDFFSKRKLCFDLLKFTYKFLPILTVLLYGCIIIYHFFVLEDYYSTAKVVIIPFVAFVTVTFMRKFINAERPYTKYNITPLIEKQKTHESFPSRHTLSITIIAMTGLYTDIRIGVILWCMAVVLATSRVLAGVHFVKDVLAAAIISILLGYLGLWVL